MAALAAAVFIVAGVGVAALRAVGTPGSGHATRPPATAQTAATPDPRVDEVKAVARRFIEALWESAKTGDTSAVDLLSEPDTEAYGNAGVAATISKSAHHNFMASRVEIEETSWRIDLVVDQATVDVSYRLFGHDADWPSLRPREPDHETTAYPAELEMQLLASKWLVTKFR